MLRLILILIFAFLSYIPSFSQTVKSETLPDKTLWQNNGIIINNSLGKSVRQNVKIVSLDDGSSVMVWEDERNGLDNIYAQRLNTKGAKLWGEGGIGVCTAAGNQTSSQIISDGKSVIIAWQDRRGEDSDIYAQKIDLDGSIVWEKDGVPVCKAPANQMAPQLCGDGNGGAVITWYDYRSKFGEDIYAQKIDRSGTAQWQIDGVSVCIENGTQWYPKIISDGSGGAVICWDDKRGADYDIYVQRLDPKGAPVWPVNGLPACKASDNQEFSQIASCEGNTFVIAWQDHRTGRASVFAQKMTLEGRGLWKVDGARVCDVAGNQERPQIAGGTEPIIIWSDYRNGSGNSDIFCQKMTSTGTQEWDPYGISVCEAPGNQMNINLFPDGTGGAVIVWEDHRNDGSGIFARRVKNDGGMSWSADGMQVCTEKNGAEFPQVSVSKGGNITITWQDRRNGGIDVYAQNLDLNGKTNWKNNGLEIVNGSGMVDHQKPKIERIGEEEYGIIWEDSRNGYTNIYAQKINNKGKLLWSRDGIRVCSTDGDQYDPDLISDGAGGAIIVWDDNRTGAGCVYAQRLDHSGNKLWNENGARICQYEGTAFNPKLASDSKSGAIIAWQGSRANEDRSIIYAQRLNGDGVLLWQPDGITVKNTQGAQMDPQIVPDGEEGAVITWTEYGENSVTPDIYAQRLNGNGNLIWAGDGIAVCKAPGTQKRPVIAANDETIIAWEDNGRGNYDIYAQKVGKDGSISWLTDGMPVCSSPLSQLDPKLILNSDGGMIFVWDDYRNSDWDIYAQRLNASGDQVWERNGVEVCAASGTQYFPQIVGSKGSSAIIAWEDYRSNKKYDLFAQKISDSGKSMWEKDGIPVCVTNGGARDPQLADDGKGGVVIVWTDYRNGSSDIYAQRINETENK
jgi:hypothetical protein